MYVLPIDLETLNTHDNVIKRLLELICSNNITPNKTNLYRHLNENQCLKQFVSDNLFADFSECGVYCSCSKLQHEYKTY